MADFFTINDVCDILRIAERTAYELCRTSQLGGAFRIGDQWRIDRAAFKTWVKKGGGPAEAEKQDDDNGTRAHEQLL